MCKYQVTHHRLHLTTPNSHSSQHIPQMINPLVHPHLQLVLLFQYIICLSPYYNMNTPRPVHIDIIQYKQPKLELSQQHCPQPPLFSLLARFEHKTQSNLTPPIYHPEVWGRKRKTLHQTYFLYSHNVLFIPESAKELK